MRLIETFERECPELWDNKHPLNKDKIARQAKQEYLAGLFCTTVEEINRKTHNLRCQFNAEMRKMKRRRELGGEAAGVSGWEYFEPLSFLIPAAPPAPPLSSVAASENNEANDCVSVSVPYTIDGINIALAEFQAEEEERFGTRAGSRQTAETAASSPPRRRLPPSARTPAHAHSLHWVEGYSPTIRASVRADECQIFGDFVASELRMLRSDESRKKLKRLVQKAILEIGEEDDYQSFR
ncbi:hypothetical protein EVAR_69646_1 [Eumeta japonica]|uniref:MADF domain-containing protein n=1 Tax=Eumeta variegata TaxID=151549 RepID=A0A4C1SZV1_EUMVA|nr:hypothetical protein EVAR_69646_1 [Eumeta japonica]